MICLGGDSLFYLTYMGTDSKGKAKKNFALALRQLSKRLPGAVCTDPASLERASLDNLRIASLPQAVIRVPTAEAVGLVLEYANRFTIPITARGAGSSATGSAVPIKGGWVLDLSLKVDPIKSLFKDRFRWAGRAGNLSPPRLCFIRPIPPQKIFNYRKYCL